MCGIFGFNWNDTSLYKKMSLSLSHRGPNNSGKFEDDLVTLGHRRLSIIDLSDRANQPMYNEDGSICIVFNGEIYNFKNLRDKLEKKGHRFSSQSDTEVIIHAYEEYGYDCLDLFDGVFSFCLYDSSKKNLWLVRDPLGTKPLYYYFDGSSFAFSSELGSLLRIGDSHSLSDDGLALYLKFRYSPSQLTLVNNIKKVMSGHYIIFNLQKKTFLLKKYYSYSSKNNGFSFDKNLKLIQGKLSNTVKSQMVADVPVGIYLSGGIDSSLVTAFAAKTNDSQINTYSVAFEGVNNELEHAKVVSDKFETNHTEFWMDESMLLKDIDTIHRMSDDPIAEAGIIPNFYLSQKVSKEATVVLAGEGGDELYGGYNYYKYFNKLNNFNNQFPLLVRKILQKVSPQLLKRYIVTNKQGFDMVNNNFFMNIFSDKEIFSFFEKTLPVLNIKSSSSNDFMKSLMLSDVQVQLAECFNQKFDRATMFNSIEGRVPLQSPFLFKFMQSVPSNMCLNNKSDKLLLRAVARKVLPKQISLRKKQGYGTPVNRWVSNLIEKELLSSLDSSRVSKLCNSKKLKPILQKKNHLNTWSIYCLENWLKQKEDFLNF